MERTTRSIFSLLLIVGLLAAGCGDDDGGDSAETTGTADGFDGTIVLGAAVSETGKYAREGEDTRQGYAIWLDWVNNEYGGIQVGDQRYRVELVMYDDESDPDTAANLVEKLITEDEVDFHRRGVRHDHGGGERRLGIDLRAGLPEHLRRADTGW